MFKHKKIVSILILAAMLLTLLPTAGFAETLDVPGDATEIVGGGSTTTEPTEETTPDITDTESGSDQGDPNVTDTDNTHNNGDSDADNTGNTVTEGNEGTEEDDVEKDEIIQEEAKEDTAIIGTAALLSAKMEKPKTYKLEVTHELLDENGKLVNARLTKHQVAVGTELDPKAYDIQLFDTEIRDWKLNTEDFNEKVMPNSNLSITLKYTMVNPVYSQSPASDSSIYLIDTFSAYCYNEALAAPRMKGIPYHSRVPYSGQEGKDADLIRAILLAGYPYDAFGLRAQYGAQYEAESGYPFTDTVAKLFTQYALWEALGSEHSAQAPYTNAILAKAYEIKGQEYKPGELHLSTESEKLNFIEQEDGSFATEAVTLYGYDGTFSLTYPDGIQIYDAVTGNEIVAGEELTTHHSLIFKSAAEPDTTQSVSANYTYRYPGNIWFYEAFSNGFRDAVDQGLAPSTGDYANILQYQNLLAFEDVKDTVTASFPITVSIKATPLEPSVPTPVDPEPTPTPDNNGGGGGGDYTPDTPSTPDEPNTPNTPSAPVEPAVPETIIPDETTPLAPAPEIVPETEAEVTLDEEPVPLAPAAPVSDNPKTGHSVNVIFILQACLLLAAAALLLNDLRQYKKAQ